MIRVHGKYIIKRRKEVLEENNYNKYLPILREDFHHICGYCGKSEKITTKGFEIDHFIPQSVDPSKKLKYGNLVYSCFTCNRKKSNDWPTGDTSKSNDGVKGYIDPATSDFDIHLERSKSGKIISKTKVGEYMVNKFKFEKRPIETIYKIEKLWQKKEELDKKISERSESIKINEYILVQNSIDDLMKRIFNKKE